MILIIIIMERFGTHPALYACKNDTYLIHVLDNYDTLGSACVTTIALITVMAGEVLHKHVTTATIP